MHDSDKDPLPLAVAPITLPNDLARLRARARALWGAGSGPAVARLFHRLLALVSLSAWLSLAVQVRVLIGSQGLLPLRPYLEAARRAGEPTFWRFPTIFWWGASDAWL